MRVAINIYFSGTPSGGMAKLVAAMQEVGATRIGSTSVTRAPIELATPEFLRFADEVQVAGEGWTATLVAGRVWSIEVRWPDAAVDTAIQMLARLIAIGAVDFAVAHAVGVVDTLGAYRDELVCFTTGEAYRASGPPGIGASTYLGARLVSLLDEPLRSALVSAGKQTGDLLHLAPATDAERRALDATFGASGVAQVVPEMNETVAGPRWKPPPDGDAPAEYTPEAEKVIDTLQSVRVDDGDDPVRDLECRGILAPFARLPSTHAENLDVEDGAFPFAELSGARIHDARFGGVDLRAVDARGSEWIDVGLVEADLRWATFAQSRLAFSRLDDANCAHIDLTEVTELDSATGACFDNATAPRWSAKKALLTGASFRGADLREASFEGARLENAHFDGADLTGANFRDADLTGASFAGATMTGTDLTGARTTGATLK